MVLAVCLSILADRVVWYATGRMAAVIEERYDDGVDAIVSPILAVSLAAMMTYTAIHLNWWIVSHAAAFLAGLFALITVELAGASVWYYLEPDHRRWL